ncbi:MAG: lytic murein transglycosylase [Hyphomicrobiales bacterium]
MKASKKSLLVAALSSFIVFSPVAGGEAWALFCSNNGARFNEWKAAFKKQYGSRYKKSTLRKFSNVKYDKRVIAQDRRNRKSFKGSFSAFYKRRAGGVAPIARQKWKKYKKYFNRAEKKFGVPPEIVLAIWGLESAFGRYKGKQYPILQSTATLAYDCRRSKKLFFKQLLAAMTVTDRGLADLSRRTGAWAGEIGQTQFLSSSFLIAATDFDGGGVNVFSSAPDVIGSTAKWFAVNGWKRGGSYQPGGHNYTVIMRWNKATVYQKTIAKLAANIRR